MSWDTQYLDILKFQLLLLYISRYFKHFHLTYVFYLLNVININVRIPSRILVVKHSNVGIFSAYNACPQKRLPTLTSPAIPTTSSKWVRGIPSTDLLLIYIHMHTYVHSATVSNIGICPVPDLSSPSNSRKSPNPNKHADIISNVREGATVFVMGTRLAGNFLRIV